MDISVVIVSYNVKEFLHQSILSLKKSLTGFKSEIIVVDNNSIDGSDRVIEREFREVQLIKNERNLGFATGCNQGLSKAKGKYLLLLNPDTLIQEDTITTMIRFFEDHPETGAAGCKILNPDGKLQLACRRSFPTPLVSIPKLIGLSHFFPKSKLFGKYNMTYKDPDDLTEVDAVSGSFLMFRREIWDQIGRLDSSFFMYGEDLDYCYRIKQAGWKIYYVPFTKIIHYKGESTKLAPFDNLITFYRAMSVFVNKHFNRGYYLLLAFILRLGIIARASVSFVGRFFRDHFLMIIDGIVITIGILLAHQVQPHPLPSFPTLISMLVFYLLLWLGTGYAIGLYDRRILSYSRAAVAALIAFTVSLLINYFFKDLIYSPRLIVFSFFIISLMLPGWRMFLLTLQRRKIIPPASKLSKALLSRRTVIIGTGKEGCRIAGKLQAHMEHGLEIIGFVDKNYIDHRIGGFPFLGTLENIREILRIYRITEIIFTSDRFNNNEIMNILDEIQNTRTEAKIVPKNLDFILGKSSVEKIEDIPLIEVDYNIYYFGNRSIKRLFDIIISMAGTVIFSPFILPYVYFKGGRLQKEKFLTRDRRAFTGYVFRKNSNSLSKNLTRFPLIWSVLKGDMSMVGSELLSANHNQRQLHCKPGITGLFQVQSNHKPNVVDKQNYEHYYMRNYSLFLDIEIILKAILRI